MTAQLEERIKLILREMPQKELRERLCKYVDGDFSP